MFAVHANDLSLATLLLLVAALLVAAAVQDLRQLWIADRYWIGIAIAFAASSMFMPWVFAVGGAAAGGVIFSIGVLLFARGWLGGGDVKLLASVALWAGIDGLAELLFNTALSGAVLALLMLVRLRRRTPANWRVHDPLRQPMPFGVAIAVGGVTVVVQRWPFC